MNNQVNFHLPFNIPACKKKIELHDQILALGSCFALNIGRRLSESKFETLSNPFGTLYSPYSICAALDHSLRSTFNPAHTVQVQGIHYHWDAHSDIHGNTLDDLQSKLLKQSELTKGKLSHARWLLLTFGTSYMYYHKGIKSLVANCHRVPASWFEKRLLTVAEIKKIFTGTLQAIWDKNPDLNVILTVSPVRHIRDGLVENNLSKSILLQAVHELESSQERVFYFPAYEIMIDQLRDYRFYKEDMVHPTDQAIDYIWSQFVNTYFSDNSLKFLDQWSSIYKALLHKPFFPDSPAHQAFLQKLLTQLEGMTEYKKDVSTEMTSLREQLIQ